MGYRLPHRVRPRQRDGSSTGTPLSNNQHPRLLLTPDGYSHARTLSEVRALCASGGACASEFRSWLTTLEAQYTSPTWDNQDLAVSFAFAFLMASGTPITLSSGSFSYTAAQYGAKARTYIMAITLWDEKYHKAAVALDWVQAYGDTVLSAGDKSTIMGYVKTTDTNGGYAVNSSNLPKRDYYNSFNAIIEGLKTLGCLALAGSGADDAYCSAAISTAAFTQKYRDDSATTNYRAGLTDAYSSYGGVDGGMPQGHDYGYAYVMPWLMLAEEGHRTANAITRSAHYGTADAYIFTALPLYTNYLYNGDAANSRGTGSYPDSYAWTLCKFNGDGIWPSAAPTGQYLQIRAVLSASTGLLKGVNDDGASLAQWLLTHRAGELADATYAERGWLPVYRWAMADVGVTAQSPSTLGLALSKLHSVGKMTARSSWTTSIDEPFLQVSAQNYYVGSYSAHNDPGALSIYRKGPVIHHAGLGVHGLASHGAEGAGGVMFPDRVATWQSITPASGSYPNTDYAAHPSGTLANTFYNNGGQRGIDYYTGSPDLATEHTSGSHHDWRGTTRFRAWSGSRDVTYFYRDLTRCYDYNNGSQSFSDGGSAKRISSYVRQVAYFMPATPSTDPMRVVVFDRATVLSTDFEINWKVPVMDAVTFGDGSTASGPSRGPEGTSNKTYSTDATYVHVVNTRRGADNKLWLTPLLPSSRSIIVVGNALTAPTSQKYENINGVKFDDGQDTTTHEYDACPFRIEVVPSSRSLTDYLLNVIEVTDSTGSRSTTAALTTSSDFVGARVGDCLAVFGKTGNVTSGTFTVPAAGTWKVQVSDLNPSSSRTFSGGTGITSITGIDPSVSSGTSITATVTTEGTAYLTIVTSASCVITVS